MYQIFYVTLKGIFRDRTFQGIMFLSILFLAIPSAASLSMRQATELSVTLSLSLLSIILLLLSVFLGSTLIWRDIERKYIFSALSLPIGRSAYLLGKFLGIAVFLIITSSVLTVASLFVIKISSAGYPPNRPLIWSIIVISIFFDVLKYLLLVAVSLLLSTVCTSFFLPVFGTICIFFAGTITQQVYDYIQTPAALKSISVIVQKFALALYYILPNLNAFDLKVNAIYSIQPDSKGIILTIAYFLIYISVLLTAASVLFSRREMK